MVVDEKVVSRNGFGVAISRFLTCMGRNETGAAEWLKNSVELFALRAEQGGEIVVGKDAMCDKSINNKDLMCSRRVVKRADNGTDERTSLVHGEVTARQIEREQVVDLNVKD